MKSYSYPSFLVVLVLFVLSCKPAEQSSNENSFGAGVSNPEAAVSLSEVAGKLNTTDSLQVIMKAKVSEVCQAKGCWMSIADPSGGSEESLFVQFQDYGFFVPKDLAGKEVIVEGKAYMEETSVEALRHYAEDEGKSAEEIAAITEPTVEKKFLATGVIVLK